MPNGITFFGGLVYEGVITSADSTTIYGGYYTGGGPLPVDVTLDGVTLDGVPFDDAGVAVQGGLTLDSDLELNNSRLIFDDSNPQAVGVGSLVSEAAILYGNIFNQSSQPVTFSPAITISGGETHRRAR